MVGDDFALEVDALLGLDGADEVARHHAALVDELVEGVLAVGAGLPKVHLTHLQTAAGKAASNPRAFRCRLRLSSRAEHQGVCASSRRCACPVLTLPGRALGRENYLMRNLGNGGFCASLENTLVHKSCVLTWFTGFECILVHRKNSTRDSVDIKPWVSVMSS